MRTKVRCMKDHSELPLRENTNHFILHVGTNNLYSDREREIITKSIVDIDSSMKKEKDNVNISNIVIRNDDLKGKTTEVNEHLKLLCKERNIC